MALDAQSSQFEIKDFAVGIPLMASALALVFEVGKFAPIGGFFFFTLSEHLVAAAPALPIALVFASGVIVGARSPRQVRTEHQRSISRNIFRACLSLIGIGGLIGTVLTDNIAFLTLGLVAILGAALLLRDQSPSKPLVTSFLVIGGLLLALATGVDNTHRRISPERADVAKIRIDNAELSATVLMAGEKNTMIFDPLSRKITVLRSDAIHSIESYPPRNYWKNWKSRLNFWHVK